MTEKLGYRGSTLAKEALRRGSSKRLDTLRRAAGWGIQETIFPFSTIYKERTSREDGTYLKWGMLDIGINLATVAISAAISEKIIGGVVTVITGGNILAGLGAMALTSFIARIALNRYFKDKVNNG